MTRRTDITKCRMEFLKQFDYYVRNIIGDEEITEHWMMFGLPDGCDEADLKDHAVDDELWLDCVKAFRECCNEAGAI